jgi:hypothetical protein
MRVSKEVIKNNREMMGNFMHLNSARCTEFILVDLVLTDGEGDKEDYIIVCGENRPNRVWWLSIRDYLSMGSVDGVLYKDLGDEIELPESFYVADFNNRLTKDGEYVTCNVTGQGVYDFTIIPTFE